MKNEQMFELIDFIKSLDGIGDKSELINKIQTKFNLTNDRSVYYSDSYAIRFSSSKSGNFSNTVLALSTLQKYDVMPFLVCVVTPSKNIIYLANTTFLKKISHSSQDFRADNIRGSFNGSDIMKVFKGMTNSPENFEQLFAIHKEIGFSGNLDRLVEATNNITPSGKKYKISPTGKETILSAPRRSKSFVSSEDYSTLKKELDDKVDQYRNEILVASLIENINIRGRIIEYLIAGEDKELKNELIEELRENEKISKFQTKNTLADYERIFDKYKTATDIKTKVMVLSSNPKAYNVDKMLAFLSKNNSVFMFYFVGIRPDEIVAQVLLSVFQRDLLNSTIVLDHWSGRNSRGVTQFKGKTIHNLIKCPNNDIDMNKAKKYLKKLINL